MADAFISYTKLERELTETLASALKNDGISVWWDTELLPTGGYRAEIDTQLDACSAAIVIWSAQSAKSEWVLSEADHAKRKDKLVNAYHTDIDPEQLPKPFGQTYAVPVTDTDSIIKAVRRLQKRESEPIASTSTEAGAMAFIRDAIKDALRYAPLLKELAIREKWENDNAYPSELLKVAKSVSTPLCLFRERLPYAGVTSCDGRRLVEKLDAATLHAYGQIRKEVGWLSSHSESDSVVSNARGDLSFAVGQLLNDVELATYARS